MDPKAFAHGTWAVSPSSPRPQIHPVPLSLSLFPSLSLLSFSHSLTPFRACALSSSTFFCQFFSFARVRSVSRACAFPLAGGGGWRRCACVRACARAREIA